MVRSSRNQTLAIGETSVPASQSFHEALSPHFHGGCFQQIVFLTQILVQVEQLFRTVFRPPNVFEMAIGERLKRLRLALPRYSLFTALS